VFELRVARAALHGLVKESPFFAGGGGPRAHVLSSAGGASLARDGRFPRPRPPRPPTAVEAETPLMQRDIKINAKTLVGGAAAAAFAFGALAATAVASAPQPAPAALYTAPRAPAAFYSATP